MAVVSVIIPNYNHARFLERRIDSVMDQTFEDFEVIILDDCSTDNSREIIERYRSHPKVAHIVYNVSNSGTTFKQWKTGLTLAKGNFIWIAESDDFAAPEFLEVLLTPMRKNERVVVSFCRSADIDENDKVLGITLHADALDPSKWTNDYIEKGKREINKYLKYRNTIPNASAVLFRKPPDPEKMIPMDMKFCGDWLFWKRMLEQPGSVIAYSSKILNFFRTHSASTRHLSKKIDLDKELIRFREYKQFVPVSFINPFDSRYRWMMAEWIDRGLIESLKHTRYRYFPLLHPAIVLRYYLYVLKNLFRSVKPD